MSYKHGVVLGAGVSGLTTGIVLLRQGVKKVTVVGKHLAGEQTVEYASPWAGASILSFAQSSDKRLQDIDRDTLKVFHELANNAPESGVSWCAGYQFFATEDDPNEDRYWVRDLFQDYKRLSKEELPTGCSQGYSFVSFCANVPQYLQWLLSQFKALGGHLEKRPFDSLQDVIEHYKDADVLVNCTGLGSAHLKDVQDDSMYGVRGQTALVWAPHVKHQWYRDVTNEDKFCTYIIPRGDGSVICGGTMDADNHDTQADPELTKRILANCCDLHPFLAKGKGPDALKVLSINVGFRPGRKGGIRLEKQVKRRSNGDEVIVCHNYGHSSHGYQSSWGSSQRVWKLLSQRHLAKL
ncbi:nucleotide-binding domain-containing protein [Hesseltinella vesiculosa]|uniref:Nucleotide-binding domain-containing protein n=1 Tax=Hesseltinella vesiculosa TaxID=101127 RepID=A0A1X2G8N8_9FUNG|nr:nucleotide-binding domain-containing protein [Hesseltinella vesiculosa]